MIRKVLYFLFAIAMLIFVSASNDVTYTFVVGQGSGNVVSEYHQPATYYVYNFVWILILVIVIFVLAKMRIFSKIFGKKKIVKKTSRRKR